MCRCQKSQSEHPLVSPLQIVSNTVHQLHTHTHQRSTQNSPWKEDSRQHLDGGLEAIVLGWWEYCEELHRCDQDAGKMPPFYVFNLVG